MYKFFNLIPFIVVEGTSVVNMSHYLCILFNFIVESEKRLIKKCRELNNEILANAAKVQNALKLNEEDQMTIIALKKEIDKAWKMVDASQEREEKAKDNIQ